MSSTTSVKFCEEPHPPGVRVQYPGDKCPLCTASRNWPIIARSALEIGLIFTQTALSGVPMNISVPNDSVVGRNAAQAIQKSFSELLAGLGVEPPRIISAPASRLV